MKTPFLKNATIHMEECRDVCSWCLYDFISHLMTSLYYYAAEMNVDVKTTVNLMNGAYVLLPPSAA